MIHALDSQCKQNIGFFLNWAAECDRMSSHEGFSARLGGRIGMHRKGQDMCRPLWAAWVEHGMLGGSKSIEVFSIPGEGAHTEIVPTGTPNLIPNMFAFECNWKKHRRALWQPNTSEFYDVHQLPTKVHYEAAQKKFNEDMGMWHKMVQWVLAGAKLYGQDEWDNKRRARFDPALLKDGISWSDYQSKMFFTGAWARAEPLIYAAGLVLHDGPRREFVKHLKKDSAPAFDTWAKFASERSNLIPLWQN